MDRNCGGSSMIDYIDGTVVIGLKTETALKGVVERTWTDGIQLRLEDGNVVYIPVTAMLMIMAGDAEGGDNDE